MHSSRQLAGSNEGAFPMKRTGFAVVLAVAALVSASHLIAQATGQGRAVITVISKHGELAPNVTQRDVSAKVNGKDADITGWSSFTGANDPLELVVLIDSGARNLGSQLGEITSFVQSLGPHTRIAVGYMQNGRAILGGPPSADHKQVVNEIHLPAGPTTNPYFSLSDLAQHWPSQDRNARREVLMLSDGVDPESPSSNPDDPYVQSAINDSVRAGLVVHTLYWLSSTNRDDSSITVNGGAGLLNELSQATGGYSYWSGTGNPVSFKPFFDDLQRRFENQYALAFTTRADRKPDVESLKLKVDGMNLVVTAPQRVYVHPNGPE
jgi:hypothetical protein